MAKLSAMAFLIYCLLLCLMQNFVPEAVLIWKDRERGAFLSAGLQYRYAILCVNPSGILEWIEGRSCSCACF